ncbi:MAG: ketoacyl-ACP synthase III [Clostridiaceae bacterium]|jgi:3-oxoacyl-[acyl-carrier-protein] synthase-3|nr:ketoacyl-ACP synthase III [Clostridiaceae bacterium]
MTKLYKAGILGTGSCLPQRKLTNAELEDIVETSDEWIVKRTGIRERRIIDNDMPLAKLAVRAAENAIHDAGIPREEIELIIGATLTPDYLCPTLACSVQKELGLKGVPAFDMNAACTGFVYALNTAQQYIENGAYKYILIVAAEALSRVTDYQDRKTCVLFGDGAGAAVVGRVEDGTGIMGYVTGAHGELGHNLTIPCLYSTEEDLAKRNEGKKQVVWMDGSEVFTFAARIMAEATLRVVTDARLSVGDLDYIFPHQANARIIQNAVKRMRYPIEKVYSNLERTGNISAASIPVCLDEASKAGMLKKGDRIVLVAFGGGLTYGALLLCWSR